ncbi:hypothetical protein HD806DRAFT_53752 [Xylariaceae sp. AK1471]|nr:hypothetical protein HD806DRAFT_53752 [Xylariaceae sp. AK1471]
MGKFSTTSVVRLPVDDEDEDEVENEQENEQEDKDEGEEDEDPNQEEGQDGENGSRTRTKTSTAVKRGRPSKAAKIAARKGKGSTKIMQQDSDRDAQVSTPRKRGRPSKNRTVRGDGAEEVASSSTSARVQGKRKRGDAEDGPRRSSRAAAETATQQIADQSVRLSNIWKHADN